MRSATGRSCEEWLEPRDEAGASDRDHKQNVAHLEREHPEVSSSWWRQSITVGYEQARGRRAVGETADAGFQIGVQRTVSTSNMEIWEVITSRPELWLGRVRPSTSTRVGTMTSRQATARVRGEVRVVKPGNGCG